MMYKLGIWNWVRLIVWLIIGLIVYFSYSRNHSKLQKQLRQRELRIAMRKRKPAKLWRAFSPIPTEFTGWWAESPLLQ